MDGISVMARALALPADDRGAEGGTWLARLPVPIRITLPNLDGVPRVRGATREEDHPHSGQEG